MGERARRACVPIAWVSVAVVAVLVRTLGFEGVFVDDTVVFPPADAQYHLRRALFTFERFPALLLFDPYINYPGGASVPWPPLFDFLAGGVARLLVADQHGFEIVMAWLPPLLGALTLVPIALAGRRLDSWAAGLLAALFYALLPIAVNYGRLANVDHHALVGAIGAWMLHLCLTIVDRAKLDDGLLWPAVLLAVARVVLLLTWHGSLLYLALAEGLLLLTAIVSGRRALLLAQAAGAAAATLCIVPVLLLSPTPLLGDYSSIALSWLHVLAMLAVVAVAGGLYVVDRRASVPGVAVRLAIGVGLATLFVLVLLLLPGPREGLLHGLRFVALQDDMGQFTGEQMPLFSVFGRESTRPATLVWGYFGFLIPVAPLAAVALARRRTSTPGQRAAAWLLAAWGAFFGALALLQRRYGNDFAPAAALLFALGLLQLSRGVAMRAVAETRRARVSVAIAVPLCVLLFWPAIARVYVPRAQNGLAAVRGDEGSRRDARKSVAATLTYFLRDLRDATPETAGYFDPEHTPAYGVIAHANIGHAVQYGARRATATDPFWAYIGRENWDLSFAFLAERDEARALAIARRLQARYVVTMPGLADGSIVARLHDHDGLAGRNSPLIEHFRLVTEAPAGGLPIDALLDPRPSRGIPYKLFEIVPGAVVEVAARPGARVVASLEIRTPSGRRFDYRTRSLADDSGRARLRVPYATDGDTPVRAVGDWRIRVGGREIQVRVPERAITTGAVVSVPPGD